MNISSQIRGIVMHSFLFICFFLTCSTGLAKDKAKPETPQLSPEQKLILITAQRDYLIALDKLIPYRIAEQQARDAYQSKQHTILEQVGADQEKWVYDDTAMEFRPAPVKPEPAKPEVPAAPVCNGPACKTPSESAKTPDPKS